jgi:hypothetical protein
MEAKTEISEMRLLPSEILAENIRKLDDPDLRLVLEIKARRRALETARSNAGVIVKTERSNGRNGSSGG